MPYVRDIQETFRDYPDSESIAVIIFFEGCSEGCPGCQNVFLQAFDPGHYVTKEDLLNRIREACTRSNTDKIVFSGGDPFYMKKNLLDNLWIISELEKQGYSICVYTGKSFEAVQELFFLNEKTAQEGEEYIHPSFLKCGRYVEALRNKDMGKDDEKFILASSNQEFYRRVGTSYEKVSNRGVLDL